MIAHGTQRIDTTHHHGERNNGEDSRGTEHRTNRRQNILELAAANPSTGACRVVVREEWPASWVENSPEMRFLKDNRRFIWASERTGWKNYYLYDLDGTLLMPLTKHAFEVEEITFVDEEAGRLFYTARSGENPMKLQLHVVGLDGQSDTRLTDPALHHRINFAPDGRHFIDIAQTHELPAVTRLFDSKGNLVAELATPDLRARRPPPRRTRKTCRATGRRSNS